MKKGDKIFVYGTLRPGNKAAFILGGRSLYLGKDRIFGLTMYNLGPFPGVVPGGNGYVVGDVFEITDSLLPPVLDNFEGYPFLFERMQATTEGGHRVWFYNFNDSIRHKPVVIGGDWMA